MINISCLSAHPLPFPISHPISKPLCQRLWHGSVGVPEGVRTPATVIIAVATARRSNVERARGDAMSVRAVGHVQRWSRDAASTHRLHLAGQRRLPRSELQRGDLLDTSVSSMCWEEGEVRDISLRRRTETCGNGCSPKAGGQKRKNSNSNFMCI